MFLEVDIFVDSRDELVRVGGAGGGAVLDCGEGEGGGEEEEEGEEKGRAGEHFGGG